MDNRGNVDDGASVACGGGTFQCPVNISVACTATFFGHPARVASVLAFVPGYFGHVASEAAVMVCAAGYLDHLAPVAAVASCVPGNWDHLASMQSLTLYQQFAQSELDCSALRNWLAPPAEPKLCQLIL